METTYNTIVNKTHIASFESVENLPHIIALGQKHTLSELKDDEPKVLLLAIDVQNDFMQDIGSLPVEGSKEDVARLTKWMFDNLNKITQVICSLDCHSIDQIFHANWWKDQQGNPPNPFTIITKQDVLDKKWLPLQHRLEVSITYLEALELNNQKQLCIWPYHCIEGSFGAKLESEFTKMLYFHAAATNSTPKLIYKGQNPTTEMYGIIKAEYDQDNFVNQPILDAIAGYDKIYIAGQASSHCVLASVQQIAEHFIDDPAITSNITLLSDCMSPITGFEKYTQEQFVELQKKYHIKIAPSTSIIL